VVLKQQKIKIEEMQEKVNKMKCLGPYGPCLETDGSSPHRPILFL
jgi:hypothetical protein